METNAKCLIKFKDTSEDESAEHFGILFDNDSVLCFCCGGYLKPGEYEIIEMFIGFDYLDQTLKEYY